jgi:DNA-binding NarL/FixJ family response regulator
MIQAAVIAPALAVRAGLRALLDAGGDIQVTAEASSLAELAALPDGVGVLVLVPGDEDGTADLKRLLADHEGLAVLLLAPVETAAALRPGAIAGLNALEGHAWGLLPLDCTAEELLAAVRALREGLLAGTPGLLEPLLRQGRLLKASETAEQPAVEPLTGRETEVLQLLAQGLANKQIAAALGISEHTVKFHVSAIYTKLGAASRTEAVRLGVRQGWVVL